MPAECTSFFALVFCSFFWEAGLCGVPLFLFSFFFIGICLATKVTTMLLLNIVIMFAGIGLQSLHMISEGRSIKLAKEFNLAFLNLYLRV